MTQERFQTGKTPQVHIVECHGDLLIQSWSDPDVLAKGDQFSVDQSETGLTVTSQGKLKLVVPVETSLALENVHGDVVVKHVNGDVSLSEVAGDAVLVGLNNVKVGTIHSDLSAKNFNGNLSANLVHGDAVLRNVAAVTFNTVYGDLSARFVNGAVELGQVMGDIGLRTVNGDLTIERGHRDANLRNLGGQVTVNQVEGDIRLYGDLAGGEHRFVAGGDIVVRWPAGAPLNLVATAPQIVNRLAFDKVTESNGSLTGQIDDGQTFVSLKANGRVVLKEGEVVREEWEGFQADSFDFDFVGDLAGLGQEISTQVNEQVARLTSELESKFGPDFTQRMAERIARKAERAAEKAERAAERAMRHAEHRMKHGSWGAPGAPTPPTPPTAPTPPRRRKATTEEQMKILRMVEKGIIGPEEANTLLDALEK